MSVPLEGKDGDAREASTALAGLDAEAQAARADLTRLHEDVVKAEDRVVATHAAQLLEANEHLVVSTVRAQTHADACSEQLKGMSEASRLDVLTSLPNRALLLDRLTQAISGAKRHRTRMALLFLDLNDFKKINDTFGHAVGDEALRKTAECLKASVRDEDTVSRHGGDEFLILLSEVTRVEDAFLVADKVIAALGTLHQLGDQLVRLTASIGISLYPDDGDSADTLIHRADAAMYLAKRNEPGSIVFNTQGSALEPGPDPAVESPPAGVAPSARVPIVPDGPEPRRREQEQEQ